MEWSGELERCLWNLPTTTRGSLEPRESRDMLVLDMLVLLSTSVPAPYPINVINLDRDAFRWSTVKAELVSKGVPEHRIQRQPAVHGASLSAAELSTNSTLLARWFATRGIIGCYLSHRAFWKSTLEHPESGWSLVLEDDVQVEDNFATRVQSCVDELESCDPDWDVLLVGALGCVHPEGRYGLNRVNAFVSGGGRTPRRVSDHVHVPRRPFGTHAYALSMPPRLVPSHSHDWVGSESC